MDKLYKGYIVVLLLTLIFLMILVWSPKTFSPRFDSVAVPVGTRYGDQTGYWVGVAVGVVGSLLVVPPLQHEISKYTTPALYQQVGDDS